MTPDERDERKPLTLAVRDGLKQIAYTVRNLRRYMTIVRFLIARMIYIDGLATVFAFGGVYAAGTFGMNEQEILLFGITLNLSAGAGAFFFSWIDDWIGSRRTILYSLAGLILPAAGMLLVDTVGWFWILGAVLGLFVGPVQASSRSYLARAAPEELRSEMFGLYALSGKATVFAGPLAVGFVTHLSGSQRIGMSVVIVLLAIGWLLVRSLPRARD